MVAGDPHTAMSVYEIIKLEGFSKTLRVAKKKFFQECKG